MPWYKFEASHGPGHQSKDVDYKWYDNIGNGEPTNPLFKMMNEDNLKRAKILDRAIAKLLKK